MQELHEPINFQRATFMTSAAKLEQCPADSGAEVAFAGRSNAGKSSCINTLTANGKLARTSKTPGRTQLINFFALDDPDNPDARQRLVDLPGYGYAKVAHETKQRWQAELERYLRNRKSLRGLVLLMDIRHPLKDLDTHMVEWAVEAGMPVHVVLTKSDKYNRGPAQLVLAQVRKTLQSYGDLVTVQCFSSLKKTGVDELAGVLQGWLET